MTTTTERSAFVAEWEDWHATREAYFREPHGWVAITALHWLSAEPRQLAGIPGLWSADGLVRVEAVEGLELPAGARGLSVLFRDATSGVTTYPASRTLALGPVADDGTVTLDLNRASNLPCGLTQFATCPIPPPENVLTVAVEAGEQWVR